MPLASVVFADVPTLIESLEAERDELRATIEPLADRLADIEMRITIERVGEPVDTDGDGEDLFTSPDEVDHADA